MPEREITDNDRELARIMSLGEKADISKVKAPELNTLGKPEVTQETPEQIVAGLNKNETAIIETDSNVTYTISRGPNGNWSVNEGIMEILKASPFAGVVKVENGSLVINGERKGKIKSARKEKTEFREAA